MMNKKEILKKVGGILNELNEQFQYLSQSPDNLNELELELFSANANFLSDHLSILVKLNDTKVESDNVKVEDPEVGFSLTKSGNLSQSPEKQVEKNVPDWKLDEEAEKEPELTFEFEEKQSDSPFEQPLTDDEKRVIDEKTTLKAAVGEHKEDYADLESAEHREIEEIEIKNLEEKDEEVFQQEVVISERTIAVPVEAPEEKPALTVNELLSRSMPQQTVAGQFNSRQATDLKGMISLNDKLLFVRDLFNGYSLAYSEALELLNRFDSFEAADNFLKQNYAVKNNWVDKQVVADKFYEILNLRFAK